MSTFLPGFEQLPLRDEAGGTIAGFASADNFPISDRKIPRGAAVEPRDELSSTEATSGFKPGVVKGYGNSLPLRKKGMDSTDTLATLHQEEAHTSVLKTEVPISNLTLSVRAIDFQVSAFVRFLSPQERAAVASRSRFRSMPWIRPAGQDDTDELP